MPDIVYTREINYEDIADAIRAKNGSNTVYQPGQMANAILALPAGQTVINNQDKTVTPTKSSQNVTYDTGYTGLGTVTVNAIPSSYIIPEGTLNITSNNTYDVTQYASAYVAVPTGSTINNQDKDVTPTESEQEITYDTGYTGLGTVTVGAISSTYVGSGITQRSSTDLSASGATVTVPAGYYSTQATKSVTSGSAGTPTASKGTVSNHSISVTPSVTNTTGYITGGTKTGTAVTVSASELVSGKKEITANGDNIDVTNYATVKVAISGNVPVIDTLSVTPTESEQTFNSSSVDGYKPVVVGAISSTYVGSGITQRSSTDLSASGATVTVPAGYYSTQASKAVSSGSATGPSSLSASSATVTTGTNTITLTKTGVTTTPTVSAGYVSSATSSTATVALTASVTTKGATTYTPGTTDQTISSGTYLTGTQTISGDSDLVAGNIKQGITIFGVEGTYSGASINNQAKSFTPDETGAEITPDTGYTGLSKVTVAAISSTYVGSGIDRRSSTDVSGATWSYYTNGTYHYISHNVAVPKGYYSTNVSTSFDQIIAEITNLPKKAAATYTPTTTAQTISANQWLTGAQTIEGDADLVAGNIKSGITIFGVEGTYSGASINNQNKTVTPLTSEQEITADSGYTGLGTVTVEAMPSGSATGPSSLTGSSATISTGTNTITLTKTGVTTTPTVSAGYVASATASTATVALTASVTVDPTPTASGDTVTIPAGYYSAQTTKSVSSMSLPSSASSTSSGTSKATITPSTSAQYLNIPTGYNSTAQYYTISAMNSMTLPSSTSSTSSGTSKATIAPSTSTQYLNIPTGYNSTAQYYTISAMTTMTLPTSAAASATSGYTSKATISRSTSDQYINIPTGYNSAGAYYKISAVANGSATGPSSISQSSATVTTGTNTITLTKTSVDTTPTVSAGYVSSATASTATVSLTASVTTKASATITPGTSDQTISAGTYLTGNQVISGDSDLVAGNIKSGVQIFGVTGSYTGLDTSDATATAGDIISGLTAYADGRKLEGSLIVQKYYTGSTVPSGSLGNNGDIYFQS